MESYGGSFKCYHKPDNKIQYIHKELITLIAESNH